MLAGERVVVEVAADVPRRDPLVAARGDQEVREVLADPAAEGEHLGRRRLHGGRAALVHELLADRGHERAGPLARAALPGVRRGERGDRPVEGRVLGRAQVVVQLERARRRRLLEARGLDLARGGDDEALVRLEHVEVADDVPEPVDELVDPNPARLGREAERRAPLAVDVARPEAQLGRRLDDRRVVRERGRVLDAEAHHCCCCWACAYAPGTSTRVEKKLDAISSPGVVDPGEDAAEERRQPAAEELGELRERELRGDAADRPLGPVGVAADRAERAQALVEAEEDGPRAGAVEEQELEHARRPQQRAVGGAERLEGAARAQERGEPHRLLAGLGREPGDDRRDDRDRPRGRVGALDVRAELEELERLAARHRRAHHALEGVRAAADADEQLVLGARRAAAPARGGEEEVQAVQLLPHLGRDLVADAAGVLARPGHARDDRVRVVRAARAGTRSRRRRRTRRSARGRGRRCP